MTTGKTPRRVLLWCPAPPHPSRPFIRDNYCSYSSKAGDLWEPVDLLYQTGFIAEAGLEPVVLDAQAEGLSPAASVERALALQPDAVLVVVGSASWENDLRQVATLARRRPGVPVVASGDLFLGAPAPVLARTPSIEAALLDYLSDGLVRFLEARRRGGPRGPVPNLAFRTPAGGVVAGRRTAPRKARVPAPRHDLFPLRRYRLSILPPGRFATVISSSGCARGCPFCVGSIQRLRLRPPEDVEEELVGLAALGVRLVYFYDPDFTSSRERVRLVCAAIGRAARRSGRRFTWAANAHVAALDGETVRRMARAGCRILMIGLESASDRTLARCRKGFSAAEAARAVARCREAGIRVLGYFLLGLPGEDERDILRTIGFARSLPLDYASFNLPVPVPGTPLHVRLVPRGLFPAGGDHSRESTVPHPTLSPERLAALRRLAVRRFYLRPGYLFRRSWEACLAPGRAGPLLRAGLALLRNCRR